MEKATQRSKQWFDQTAKHYHCPVSGASEWEIGEEFVSLTTRSNANGQLLPYGQTSVLLFFRCKRCAYVLLFSAQHLGMLK